MAAADPPRPDRGTRRFYDRELAGTYRTDARTGAFLDCNEAMARILGYGTREELMAAGARDLYYFDRDLYMERVRQRQVVTGAEACLKRRDGSPVVVVYSERLCQEDGREVLEGTLIELSQRAAPPADRALSAVVSGVGQQVSGPLATVVANLGYAIESLATLSREVGPAGGLAALDVDEALRDARRGADAIRRTLRDLAVFAAPQGAGATAGDLRRALESAVGVVSAQLEGQVTVITEIDESLPLKGDERLVGRCVLQLLLDAVDAMADGAPGHVLSVRGRRDGRGVSIEVEDTGRRAGELPGAGHAGCRATVAALGGTVSMRPLPRRGRLARLEFPSE